MERMAKAIRVLLSERQRSNTDQRSRSAILITDMKFEKILESELKLRQDCVQADTERLIACGASREAVERVVEHSLQIGIILDKLNNLKMHALLEGND